MSRFTPKIRGTSKPLPEFMWGIKDERGHFELEAADPEYYILLFFTKEEAEAHIYNMNEEYWINDKQERVYWYKNRGNKSARIKTTLKKFKPKFKPFALALSEIFA